MKKLISLLAAAVVIVSVFAVPCAAYTNVNVEPGYDYTRFKDAGITLNVYNWGLYISEEKSSLEVNKAFEELTGIKVNYTTYDTNESMYAKIKSGGGDYDVIFPSDYMVSKMAKEGLIQPLDFDNIPNYSMIGEKYKNQPYDPENKYSVPYTWGVVGICYNKTMVDEEDLKDGWGILWNEKYSGQILMFNNSRDAFAIGAKYLGLSMNPENTEQIEMIANALKEQKLLVQAYVMDEIFDKMEGGEAALAPYYAGDGVLMHAENPDLEMFIPPEGTNYYVDAMCIPSASRNKEAAEMYINFMCETEVALANCNFICYSTPQLEAEKLLSRDLRYNKLLYPDEEVMNKTETFIMLDEDINAAMDSAWSDIRSFEKGNIFFIPILAVTAVVAAAACILRKKAKERRSGY